MQMTCHQTQRSKKLLIRSIDYNSSTLCRSTCVTEFSSLGKVMKPNYQKAYADDEKKQKKNDEMES